MVAHSTISIQNNLNEGIVQHYTLYTETIASPVGALKLVASDRGLCAVLFDSGKFNAVITDELILASDSHPLLLKTKKQMAEYFAGKRKEFDLPLDMRGTIFQLKAWKQLQKIPYGKTISYAEQAKQVGDIKKARAVGMANGRNPLAIVVPCHRVIGTSGALVGFGGGLNTKQRLLDLERAHAA